MQIQVNTGHNIEGSQALRAFVEESFSSTFERYEGALTRIIVHLTDENAGKSGPKDKKCQIEARLANRQPVSVSDKADSIHEAINHASDKLLKMLDRTSSKLTNHKSPSNILEESQMDMQ